MSEREPEYIERITVSGGDQYGITIPLPSEDFGEFVSSLLGKAQTIQKVFRGVYDIGFGEIETTYHLVNQRIRQQNEATLVQFTVKIIYSDNSSVLLNSIADFLSYKEVTPVVSVAAELSWTYLIRFQNKKFPEKQVIEMSIGVPDEYYVEGLTLSRASRRFYRDGIVIRISHTDRTWGVDILSLLNGHVTTLLKEESRYKRFIYEHADGIGTTVGYGMLISSVVMAYVSTKKYLKIKMADAQRLISGTASAGVTLEEKVNYLIKSAAEGGWPRYSLVLLAFLVLATGISLALSFWVTSRAQNWPQSFVLLSKKAEEKRIEYNAARAKKWYWLALSLLASIVTGVVSNYVFVVVSRYIK